MFTLGIQRQKQELINHRSFVVLLNTKHVVIAHVFVTIRVHTYCQGSQYGVFHKNVENIFIRA